MVIKIRKSTLLYSQGLSFLDALDLSADKIKASTRRNRRAYSGGSCGVGLNPNKKNNENDNEDRK